MPTRRLAAAAALTSLALAAGCSSGPSSVADMEHTLGCTHVKPQPQTIAAEEVDCTLPSGRVVTLADLSPANTAQAVANVSRQFGAHVVFVTDVLTVISDQPGLAEATAKEF